MKSEDRGVKLKPAMERVVTAAELLDGGYGYASDRPNGRAAIVEPEPLMRSSADFVPYTGRSALR